MVERWYAERTRAERVEDPNLVVINLGVNDETLTAAEYGDYLARVRSAYQRSTIVALSPFSGKWAAEIEAAVKACLLYTSPSPRDLSTSRMPSSA